MERIDNYTHDVASHCESGSVRNVLVHFGLDISEPMVFGIGSGPAFFYLFFAKGPNGLPLIGIRNAPGSILKNVSGLLQLEFVQKRYKTTDLALAKADELITRQIPVIARVDMFYMKYLPQFLQVHAPFHTIVLVGRNRDAYAISDPYFNEIAELRTADLKPAWETHAAMAQDNYLSYIDRVPERIDWRRAITTAMIKTSRNMLLPPVVDRLFFFVGVQGIRTYAKKILSWPDKYRGVRLREGILFQAVGFEDQGTGGGAFRLMYGAFLQEAAQLLNSAELESMAGRMIENGLSWQEISRKFIKVGKPIPLDDDAYDDWSAENRPVLGDGLAEISADLVRRAEFEDRFFKDLRKAATALR